MSGREIIDEQDRRHGAQSEYTLQQMTLIDKNNNQEIRNMREYSMDISDDHSRSLIVFDTPESIMGTALLTWWNRNDESDQWMYLPAQKRMQRIAKGSKKGYFMGSDFSFEDIQPEKQDNFDFEIAGETTISGLPCWMIEVTPNNTRTMESSGYSRRILYILKEYFFTVKIEFYDKWNVLLKTQQNGLLQKIDGSRFRANKIIMINHQTDHKTIIETEDREINQKINEDIFTERYITTGRHLP
ncbi:MAG: outer membrane lipoprotein-sorting protein [Spirochaetaceae bacterium]|nr:outer membrane lipoprotein-sorting protein [Spirochaetaceae bacterium]